MNSKKNKNKSKQNKQQIPHSSTKIEISNPESENKESIDQKPIEIQETPKHDDRVPEIISERITPSVSEIVPECDVPKKPKRNRGKKKKSETDHDFADEKLQKDSENTTRNENVVEVKSEVIGEMVKEQPLDTIKTAPNARKKNNKSNDGLDNTETKKCDQPLAEQPLKITMLTKSEAENIMSDVKIVTCVPISNEGLDQDSKKKKNKKKKRTDSEKSDKEDILACTAAFQKLLEPREDKKETKTLEQKSAPDQTTEKENASVDNIFIKTLQPNEQTENDAKDTLIDEVNKSKKKNKKDKNRPSKNETEDGKPKQEIDDSTNSTAEKTNILVQDFVFQPITKEESTVNTLKEEIKSPKLKAKIGKPVERKGTEVKTDALIEDELLQADTKPLSLSDLLPLKECSEPEPEIEVTKTEGAMDMESESMVKIQTHEEDTAKKSKKSPKPPKRLDELKSEENVELEVTVCDPKTESAEMPPLMPIKELEEPQRETKNSKTEMELQQDPTPSNLSSESKLSTDDNKSQAIPLPFTTKEISSMQPMVAVTETLEQTSITEEERSKSTQENKKQKPIEATVETFRHIPSPDGGMGKKRKKSPKPSLKPDINKEPGFQEFKHTFKDSLKPTDKVKENLKSETLDSTLLKDNKTEIKSDKKEIEPKCSKTNKNLPQSDSTAEKKTKEKPEMASIDIEVSSVRTESESSLCDISPTIDYPRSSSQSADGNNNVSITEIVSGDGNIQISLGELNLDLPSIHDCEKSSPKVQTGIKITTVISQTKPSEKTDLKSKMMEVNQDMEGLRRSIEKSLAELSAIEKTEKTTEQQFLQAHEKIEHIKHMALQQQANIRESVAKDPEKIEGPSIKSEYSDTNILPKAESVERTKLIEENPIMEPPKTPEPPARKDNKGKGKSKKKGKQEAEQTTSQSASLAATSTANEPKHSTQETKQKEKQEHKPDKTPDKGKQQSTSCDTNNTDITPEEASMVDEKRSLGVFKSDLRQFDHSENYEDALTSSVDDVNKTFEIISNESNKSNTETTTEPSEKTDKSDKDKTDRQSKINPVSQPKNLLGRPAIPARLNKMDYKKEKNKTPSSEQAEVKIKDSMPIDSKQESRNTRTDNKIRFLNNKAGTKSDASMAIHDEEYVYKYSFRRVFLPNACHVCKLDLKSDRVPCNSCNLVFYCSPKHTEEDHAQHQALCFAVSTIARLKDQKHLYANTANITGHDYRLLRMQMIVSCEKVLKRRLVPCEQEMLLYPRVCADPACREWRQHLLKDCDVCGQISYCPDKPHHFPSTHQKWCKSYSLYQKLVTYQQLKGRLEPKFPSKVMTGHYQIPDKMNEVLASMYEEKIDMSDIQYAALTQVATAPLTAAYCVQLHSQQMNSSNVNGARKISTCTVQVVGAELQFEADVLNKWEIFFLHLRPDVVELKVVLMGPELNSGNLPLDLLGKIKLCENCRLNKRRVIFDFQDKKSYYDYWLNDFTTPDIVCAFNPSIQRSSIFNGKDTWPSAIKCILKQKVPFVVTSYTMNELHRDLARIKECSADFNVVSEPKYNSFASVRPDRNFISDDEMPLLFKNYCYMVICGAS